METRSCLSRYILELRKRRGFSAEYTAHLMKCSVVKYIQLEQDPFKASNSLVNAFFSSIDATREEKWNFLQVYFYESIGRLNGTFNASYEKNTESELDTDHFSSNVISLKGLRSIEPKEEKESKEDAD